MQLPSEVPVMTLPSATLFPQALLPLYIFEPRYRKMVADSLKAHRMFSVAMQKPGCVRESPCSVAGLGLIRVSVDHADGTSHLILQGIARVELKAAVRYKPYRIQRIKPLQADSLDTVVVDALRAKVQELVRERLEIDPLPLPLFQESAAGKFKSGGKSANQLPVKDVMTYLDDLSDADQFADLVSCALLSNALDRQTILETLHLEKRLRRLIRFLMAEVARCRDKRRS